MVKYIFSFVLVLVLAAFNYEHKFYMSLTDVNWNDSSSSLELTTRFFTDDVERAISSDERLLKIDESMDEDLIPLLRMFYEDNIQAYTDQKELDITFIGYEVENELIWCYAEASNENMGQELTVKSTWLYNLFESQVNIINVHIGDVRSAYLNRDDRMHVFALK